MSKLTKATDINAKTRKLVKERDGNRCIFCGSNYGIQICHYRPRSALGLGIKENLFCGCYECHYQLDHTTSRAAMLAWAKVYLDRYYPEFSDKDRTYKKGR